MLTNSSSLELVHVGKTFVEVAWTRLRDGTQRGPLMSSRQDPGRALLSLLPNASCHFSQGCVWTELVDGEWGLVATGRKGLPS